MRITTSTKTLNAEVNKLSKVIPSKCALVILEYIKIEATEGEVTLTATDIECELTVILKDAKVEQLGKALVPAAVLRQLLKQLGDQPVTIDVNEETCESTLSTLAGNYSLGGANPDCFPRHNKSDNYPLTAKLSGKTIKDGVNAAAPAVQEKDGYNPILGGVYMELAQKKAVFVGCDGARLHKFQGAECESQQTISKILPMKICSILTDTFGACESVDLVTNDTCAVVSSAGYELAFSLTKGIYPPYQQLMGRDKREKRAIVTKALLANALKRAAILADDVYLQAVLTFSQDGLTINVNNVANGNKCEEHVPCDYMAEDISLAVSINKILEAIDILDGEEIQIQMEDPSRAIIITDNGLGEDKAEEVIGLVMPLVFKS